METTNTAHQSIKVQAQIRIEAEEHATYLKGLRKWEESMKENDDALAKKCKESVLTRREKYEKIEPEMCEILPADLSTLQNTEHVINHTKDKSADPAIGASGGDTSDPTPLETEENLEGDARKKGNINYGKGRFEEAVRNYSNCLAINPRSYAALSNRSMAYLKLKEWINAETDASAAINIKPDHVKSYQRRSTARVSLGKLRAALVDSNTALKNATSQGLYDACKSIDIETKNIEKDLRDAVHRAPKRSIHVNVLPINHSSYNNTLETKKDKIKEAASDKEIDLKLPPERLNKEIQHSSTSTIPRCNQSNDHAREISQCKHKNHQPKKKINNPKSWYEFEMVWKAIAPEERTKYLSRMKPTKISKIFKNGIEKSELLMDIMQNAIGTNDAAGYFIALSNLPGIDITIMMLTKSEKEEAKKFITLVFKNENNGYMDKIAAKFGV